MTATVTQADRWIGSICERFANATGWPLRFVPAGTAEADALADASARDEFCWVAPLEDGQRAVGWMLIDLPPDQRLDRTFLGMSELAAIFAELIARTCSAWHKLDVRSSELSTLVEIGMTIPRDDDIRSALGRLLEAALRLTGFRSAAFFLLDPATRELRLRAEQHIEPRRVPQAERQLAASPPDEMALSVGRAVLRLDAAESARVWLPDDCLTAMCLRVQAHGGPLGTLWAYDRRTRDPAERETHVLESIAAQIAAALERTVLRHESAVQHRLQRELKTASENQGLGFRIAAVLDPRVDVASICTSHHEVGGDLCEVISLDEHRTLIAAGDAAGRSIPAAMIMSAVRGALRTACESLADDPSRTDRLVERINAALHAISPSHQFMSFVAGVVDTDAWSFTYTNAGHPLPILLRRNRTVEMHSHGLLLGVMDGVRYDRSVVDLTPGDLIALYSDGISEARCKGQRMFRTEGIVGALRRHAERPARDVIEGVLAELRTHTHGAGEGDDRTLLVARFRSTPD